MTDVTQLTDNGLLSMHGAIIKALEIDDQSRADKPFNVRATTDWRQWAAMLESEMNKRGITFRKIPW